MRNLKQRHMHYCETNQKANKLAAILWENSLDEDGLLTFQRYTYGKEIMSDWLDQIADLQSPHTLYAVEHLDGFNPAAFSAIRAGIPEYRFYFWIYERIAGDLHCTSFIDLEHTAGPRLYFEIINKKSGDVYRKCILTALRETIADQGIRPYFKILENANETNLKDLCRDWKEFRFYGKIFQP